MDQRTMYARYHYLALRVRRDAVPPALHAEYKQLRALLDADSIVFKAEPLGMNIVAENDKAAKLMMSSEYGKLNGDRIAIVEKRRAALSDPTIEYGRKWSQYHNALQAAYEGGDLVPKPRRKLASAGQVFEHPECVGCGYGAICDVYDDMDEIYSRFMPIGGLDRLTEYQRWPEWLVALIEAPTSSFDPKTNRVVTRLLKPHELATLKVGKAWRFFDIGCDDWLPISNPSWEANTVYRTV